MRKPRAVVFVSESLILGMLRDYFQIRGYEVLFAADPTAICPVHGAGGEMCANFDSCTDVMITDFHVPGLNGVELYEHQIRKGCPLDNRNKAVLAGYIDPSYRRTVDELGFCFLQKPFTIFNLSDWLAVCEQRMDLSKPLATRRREERFDASQEIVFRTAASSDKRIGVTVNISRSGFCFKVPHALKRGDVVNIEAGYDTVCRQASVRWTKPAGKGAFIVGMLCR